MDRYWEDDSILAPDGRIGRLLRVGWDDDQADLEPPLSDTEVQVIWSPKEVSVETLQDDWKLAERMLMRGDIVVHGGNKNGQMGTVVDVYTFAKVGPVYGEGRPSYECVPTQLLFPASEWRFELLVWRNGWIGSVHKLFWRLKVQLEDSQTILTIDTRTMKHTPVALKREPSPVLKPDPSEGTFILGTTLAVHKDTVIEDVEGDEEWVAASQRRTLHPEYLENISENRDEYAIGKIISTEISSLHVIWLDHAVGSNVGDTKPTTQQRLSDVRIVDPFYHNSFCRYELTWISPDIIDHYSSKTDFVFPDGTIIPSSSLKSSETSNPGTSNPTPSNSPSATVGDHGSSIKDVASPSPSNSSTASAPTIIEDEPKPLEHVEGEDSFISYAPSNPALEKPAVRRGSRYASHPEPGKVSTMSGHYERHLTPQDRDRQHSLNAPFIADRGHGYTMEELGYVQAVTRFVDVQWQDGSISRKVPTTDLVSYLHLGDTDFQPLDYVQSVPTTVEEDTETRRGVIQTVDHANRVATIWWIKSDQIEPHVSIYMLDDADSRFHYRIGYFVLRTLGDSETQFDGTIGLADNMDERGRVYVIWAEGTSGWYYPSQLIAFDVRDYDVDAEDDEPVDQLSGDPAREDDIRYIHVRFARPDHDDEYEWESESAAGGDDLPRSVLYMDGESEEEDVSNEEYDEDDDDDDSDDSGMDTGDDGSHSDGNSSDHSSTTSDDAGYTPGVDFEEDLRRAMRESAREEEKRQKEIAKAAANAVTHDEDNEDSHPKGDSSIEIKKTASTSGQESETTDSDSRRAPFRLMEELSPNHFYRSDKLIGSYAKLAMKEWKLLQEATLQGAYVLGYEDRVDCFRFLIVGAPETPFYLSWFLFDLHLPEDYPNHPPRVHFRSLGPKLHPNLYEDGNVCLSLLGTWNGSGIENWDPAHSNILQVVLSIQGLILGVKEPYYLEAGYDRHRGTAEGEANSLVYNERSFLLSVQQMRKLIESPPIEFKDLVLDSFRSHKALLLSLEATLSSDPEKLASIDLTAFGLPKGPPSIGFRSAFKAIFPAVKKALESL
jgi:ubiquitin-protein ligase